MAATAQKTSCVSVSWTAEETGTIGMRYADPVTYSVIEDVGFTLIDPPGPGKVEE